MYILRIIVNNNYLKIKKEVQKDFFFFSKYIIQSLQDIFKEIFLSVKHSRNTSIFFNFSRAGQSIE